MAVRLTRRTKCSTVALPTLTVPTPPSIFVRLDSPDETARNKGHASACVLNLPLRRPLERNHGIQLRPHAAAGALRVYGVFHSCSLFQRYRWQRRKRKGKSNWGFCPSSSSLGNALQELSVMAQPQVQHVLDEQLSEDGPEDPVAHLYRQAAKTRKVKDLIGSRRGTGCSYRVGAARCCGNELLHRPTPTKRITSIYPSKGCCQSSPLATAFAQRGLSIHLRSQVSRKRDRRKNLRRRCREQMCIPGLSSLDHGVETNEELSHTGHQGHLGCFTALSQVLVEGANCRVEAKPRDDGHV